MSQYLRCNKELFKQEFKQTEIYNQLTKDYQTVLYELPMPDPYEIWPRRTTSAKESTFYYSTFYYLNLLLEKNPKTILDLGCGGNYFKNYIPQIIGIDPDVVQCGDTADIIDGFSEEFVQNNLEKFDCAFTIGAIHNVSLAKLADRINEFGKLIKQGGRGYFAVNIRRSMQYTELHEFAQLFDLTRQQTILDLYKVFRNECKKIDYKIIALDITILDDEEKRYNSIKGTSWPTWGDFLSDNISGIDPDIINEIAGFNFGASSFTANGPSEPIDGNLKLVFEKV